MEHRHLWLRSPRQAAILRVRAEIIKAARDFFDDRGFTLHRSADPHARRLRRHHHAVPRRLLRGAGVPHAVRPALHRSHGDGAGQGLQLRPDVPRGEVEDAPPSHRVLDGRARGRVPAARRPDGAGRRVHHLDRDARAGEPPAGAGDHRPRHRASWRRSRRRSRASPTTKR